MADEKRFDSKGKEKQEYPKLVRTPKGKVLVQNKKEEDAIIKQNGKWE